MTGAGNSRYGTGEARRGESSCRGKNRRFRHVIRGITACPTALLLFTACDADTAVDASARPAYSVTAGAPAYALTPTSVNIQINEYFRFQALLTDGSGTKVSDVTYTTSNPSVATVNAYGTVRGRGNGTTTLTATSPTYGVSTAAVNVGTAVTAPTTNDPLTTATTKPEMKTIALTPATVSVAAGTTTQLSAVAKDQYGTAISGVTFIWTSADTAIATVSTTGALTGATPGQTSIRATSGGISATTSVTVTETVAPSTPVATTVVVTSATATVTAGWPLPFTATVKDQAGNAMTGVAVTWASANPAIATVTSSGLVTGIAAGQVAIAATAFAITGSALVTVKAPASKPAPALLPATSNGPGIWLSRQEILALPTSGSAWSNVSKAADASCGTPNLADQENPVNVCVLAKALVYARKGGASHRDGVLAALRSIVNSGTYVGRALALARELPAYVIAADIIDLKSLDPALDTLFRAKINELRTTYTGDDGPDSLIECHDGRANNWGTWCGAARVAVALYLGDRVDFDNAVLVMRGWLGDRSVYTGFSFGELTWQADPLQPVAVQPKGATRDGYPLDGALAEELRRCGAFVWPPCLPGYSWGALEGAVVTLYMLHRQGLPAREWSDRALLRAYFWLYGPGNDPAIGNDRWQPYLVNYLFGTTFPTVTAPKPGKNMGWTDWTHAKR